MMNRKEQLSTKTIWRPLGMGALWVAIPAILTALNVGGQQALWEVVHWTVATWGMVALGVWGWRQAEGVTRQVRGVLTLGLISYALGQLLWDVQWLVGEVQFPAFSDVFYLSVSLFFMAALVISAHGRLSLADELALYLDTSMIFTAQASMIAIFYVPRAASLDGAQTALLVAYPVIFLAAAGAGLVGALKAHARFMLASPYPLLGGLAFSGLCWVIWNSMFLDGPILPGTWVGYGFSLAHLILGAGVAVWDLTPTEHLRSLIWARRMLRLLPVLAIPLAVVALMWGQTDHVLSQWLNLGGVGVIMLALLRQSLLFWERDSFFVREHAALRRAEQALTERQQAERARQALLDIMRGGITTTDLADFLSLVHRTINRVIYAENFFISLYDKTTGLFEEVYCVD
ncbi:MAG: hypothetical protein HUU38_21705, partial [Anaerolineales bacterium]|nr:hypothetical protein [Anaerolineales bacterium]